MVNDISGQLRRRGRSYAPLAAADGSSNGFTCARMAGSQETQQLEVDINVHATPIYASPCTARRHQSTMTKTGLHACVTTAVYWE